jgi:hypothetical protein
LAFFADLAAGIVFHLANIRLSVADIGFIGIVSPAIVL